MNNSSDKILVVARKYNDIFYAISTSEWSQCSRKRQVRLYFPQIL